MALQCTQCISIQAVVGFWKGSPNILASNFQINFLTLVVDGKISKGRLTEILARKFVAYRKSPDITQCCQS